MSSQVHKDGLDAGASEAPAEARHGRLLVGFSVEDQRRVDGALVLVADTIDAEHVDLHIAALEEIVVRDLFRLLAGYIRVAGIDEGRGTFPRGDAPSDDETDERQGE